MSDNTGLSPNDGLGGPPAKRQKIEDVDVDQLDLSQLKSEKVRLGKEFAIIASRMRAVDERMNEIISMNRAGGARKKTLTSQEDGSECCQTEGCSNKVYKNGRCQKHTKRPICSAEGCTNNVQRAGLCQRHGDYISKRCKHEGCSKHAQSKSGLCYEHGAPVPKCHVEGCMNRIQRKGVCIKVSLCHYSKLR